jgi:hypothetical protein
MRCVSCIMFQLWRQGLSTFWADASKAMLVTAVPCLVLDWIVLNPTRTGVFTVFLATAGVVLVPLTLFAIASLALFFFRRPGWLLGPVITMLANSAFLDFIR